MSRRLMFALALMLALVPLARAQGRWSTHLRMKSCNDLIPRSDTVWVATGEAGLLRYARSAGTWTSITREPNGLAGNNVRAITFDRSGNLYAAVPGKGVSRLDTGGRWSLLNAFDGLPSDSALVLRAQGDTVWIGTTKGLALWDGRTVAGSVPDLGTPSPFVDNYINGIAVTGDTLFVSTPKGVHLARISQRLRTWTLVNNGLPISGSAPGTELHVRGVACDAHNLLAVASGVDPSRPTETVFTSFRWDPSQGRWVRDYPSDASVRRIRDDSGVIICTTPTGIFRRAFGGGWTLIPGSPATDNNDGIALEPAADSTGHSFASFAGRLHEEGLPAWSSYEPPGPVGNNCRNIAWANGTVYACYDGEGVGRLRDGTWRNYRAGVGCTGSGCDTTFTNPNYPTGLLVDPFGTKWIGVWSGSLSRFDDEVVPPRFRNIRFASNNPDTVHLHSCVHAAAADLNPGAQSGRWFGLDSDRIGDASGNPLGLDVYDTAGTFVRNYNTNYPGLRNGLIRALEVDRANRMWVGYKGSGLSTFAVPASLQDSITLSDVPGSGRLDVFGLAILGDSVWALAADGLHRFRQGSRALVTTLQIAAPPALLSVHPIAITPDGSVYVGTTGGLRVHRRGQLPVDYTPDNSPLADFEVRAVYAEPTGAVWIGTARGVNRFEPDYRPPPPPRLNSLSVDLYPNPAWRTGVGFALRLKGGATSYDGEVFDLNGRLVHRFHADGNGAVVWNGRDLDQRWVGAGVYFVRVRGGGAEATSRVVVLR